MAKFPTVAAALKPLTIALPSTGAQGAAGKYLSADAVGEWVRLLCVKAGQWQVAGYAGTWTAEG